MNYNPKTPKEKIPPDIFPPDPFSDSMQLTNPTVFINKGKGKAVVNQPNQSTSDSLINYQLIQRILNTELQFEKDKDVQNAIQKQLKSLEAILEFKKLGKKEKLEAGFSKQVEQKTTENAVVSQLQKQVENLEKSVENKFSLILKSIETKSQEQIQNQSQILN